MASRLNLEVGHAVILVCDIDKMIDFYTGVLGFEVTDRGPLARPGTPEGTEIVFLSQASNHHHQVAFVNTRSGVGPSNSVDHVAFRTSGTLDDLRALEAELRAHEAVTGIRPITHGNAWSVYFRDPEGNGVEIFLDTPWHVAQPQGRPLDLSLDTDAITEWTEREFRDEPEFGPIDDFYAKRASHLGRAD
ncbi:MAG: VOC family protein [Acidimicrobiia bacterium]|nr:VOC family protein [Acidimicrobiia bacterium]